MVRENWQRPCDADIDNNALSERNLLVQHGVLHFIAGAGLQGCIQCSEKQHIMVIMTHSEHHEQLICTGLHACQERQQGTSALHAQTVRNFDMQYLCSLS